VKERRTASTTRYMRPARLSGGHLPGGGVPLLRASQGAGQGEAEKRGRAPRPRDREESAFVAGPPDSPSTRAGTARLCRHILDKETYTFGYDARPVSLATSSQRASSTHEVVRTALQDAASCGPSGNNRGNGRGAPKKKITADRCGNGCGDLDY